MQSREAETASTYGPDQESDRRQMATLLRVALGGHESPDSTRDASALLELLVSADLGADEVTEAWLRDAYLHHRPG